MYSLHLAHALFLTGSHDKDAIVESREAIQLDRWWLSRHNLDADLFQVGKWDQSLAEYRDLIRRYPNNASIRDNFITILERRGEVAEVIRQLRELVRLLPEFSHARKRLADALFNQGDVVGSMVRFYREAFQARPALADDVTLQHRRHAAIGAAQAGTNSKHAKVNIRLDDAERARWRAQALDWLLAEKDACAKILAPTGPANAGATLAMTTGPANRALARRTPDIMTHHRDLACVRDEKELARLPEPECKEWQAFWSEVAVLLKKAENS